MEGVSEAILELEGEGTVPGVPIFTEPAVFDRRHLAEPSVSPAFWEGEVPDFRLACRGDITVAPEKVDVSHDVPDDLCGSCEASMSMSFLRGPRGGLEVD